MTNKMFQMKRAGTQLISVSLSVTLLKQAPRGNSMRLQHLYKRVFAKALRTDRPTEGRTDGGTDRRTDTPSYRDAKTHLKKDLKSYLAGLSK